MDSDDFTLDEDMYFINDTLSVGPSSEPLVKTVKSGSTVYKLIPTTEKDSSKIITINKPKTTQNTSAPMFTLESSGTVTKVSTKVTPTISPQLILPSISGESKMPMTQKIVSISNPTLAGKTRPVESLKQKIIQLDRSYNEVKRIETLPGQVKKVGGDEVTKISQDLKPSVGMGQSKPAIQLVYKNSMGNNVILCPTRVKPAAPSPGLGTGKPSTSTSTVPLISISKPVTDPPISIQQNRGVISGTKVTPMASYRLPQQVLKSTVLPGGTLHKIRVTTTPGQAATLSSSSGQTVSTPTIKVVRAPGVGNKQVLPLLNPGLKTVMFPSGKPKSLGVELKGFNLGGVVTIPGEFYNLVEPGVEDCHVS
ncbi:hypothetical protein WDU94_006240 [Cyamophila willieti]